MATLTFVYADSTAVLGPLALQATPGCYDLCATHAASMSAPRGWEIIRLTEPDDDPPAPDEDDLLALANAVREIGFADTSGARPGPHPAGSAVIELGRRGHLRVIADAARGTID